MNLQDDQREQVRAWIEQGLQPAEIQKRLTDELGLRLTYMEVRFLLADLGLKPKDKEMPASPDFAVVKPAGKEAGRNGLQPRPDATPQEMGDDGAAAGGVSLSVDQVTRAGAVVSGKVAFSDGKSAEWYLDQMGRLGLAPKEKGYKPSQSDLMDFQMALQNELAKLGF